MAPCLAQAGILAARLAGESVTPFTLMQTGMRLKVTGVELFSVGEITARENDAVWTSWDPLTHHYRRLLVRNGTLRRTGCSIDSLRSRRLQDKTR